MYNVHKHTHTISAKSHRASPRASVVSHWPHVPASDRALSECAAPRSAVACWRDP